MEVIDIENLYPGPRPTIQFTNGAYIKMLGLVHASDIEVQWHGLVSKEDEHTYTVYDILVYPQIATAATVTSDDAEYAMWMMELEDKQINHMRMQGHSHVNMGVGPSSIDHKTFNKFMTQVKDYYIFIIMNKKHEMHARLYDVEKNVLFINSDIKITRPKTWGDYQLDEYVSRLGKQKHKPIASKADPKGGELKDGHQEIPRVLRSR